MQNRSWQSEFRANENHMLNHDGPSHRKQIFRRQLSETDWGRSYIQSEARLAEQLKSGEKLVSK